MKKTLTSLVCAVSALALLLGACGSQSDSKDDSSSTFSPEKGDGSDDTADQDKSAFKNGVLSTRDLKIQITRYKVIKVGQKGNEYGEKPVIAFFYKTTNISGKETDPTDFIFSFNAYQDNNPNAENKLEVGLLPDDRFLETQTEKIKKGGTVESAIAYDLDDLTTPVDLVATEGMDDDAVIGKATYKLK